MNKGIKSVFGESRVGRNVTDIHGGRGGKTRVVERQKEPKSSQTKDWTLSEGKLWGKSRAAVEQKHALEN